MQRGNREELTKFREILHSKIGAQIIDALIFLSEKGVEVIHGDIKPDNIIVR